MIQTSYKCLLLNGVAVVFLAQTENAWFSFKPVKCYDFTPQSGLDVPYPGNRVWLQTALAFSALAFSALAFSALARSDTSASASDVTCSLLNFLFCSIY